jgi:hypothetical protein
MEELILDKINNYCNENYNWFDNFIECKDLEVYDKNFELVALIDFEIKVEVFQLPSVGNYFDAPEYGECDFNLFSITVKEVYNTKGKLLPNLKEKIQKLLENRIGKNL